MATAPVWTPNTQNDVPVYEALLMSLPGSAIIKYSSEIDFIRPNLEYENQWVAFIAHPSAISGTNLDIALYGAYESGGTKVLLKDAIIADLTVDDTPVVGLVDMNLYPCPYYYIGVTADGDESANTISYRIIVPIPKFK